MSRALVFGLDNTAAGEVHGICNRAWAVNDGGKSDIELSETEGLRPWLEIGRMVYVEHEKLPAWAGMIDTPWNCMRPQLTAYDPPYLLALRSPEARFMTSGTTVEIVQRLVRMANRFEDLYLRPGNLIDDGVVQEVEITTETVWEQVKRLVTQNGQQIIFRPVINNQQLIIYFDLSPINDNGSDYLLQDGAGGNCRILSAAIDGEIWNRVLGTSDESTEESRIVAGPVMSDTSIMRYRLRNNVRQFGELTESELQRSVENALRESRSPVVALTVEVVDQGDTFKYIRPGSNLRIRATRLILPGGRAGWEGMVRILAMAYNEGRNVLTFSAEGAL